MRFFLFLPINSSFHGSAVLAWLSWVFYSGSPMAAVKVSARAAFPSGAPHPLPSTGCWQSQFLVVVGLRSLISCCLSVAPSSQRPPVFISTSHKAV